MLHPWDKPRNEEDCEIMNTIELLDRLDEILRRNQSKKIVLAAHHPVFTYGIHGGRATLREHLFPLTEANKALYLPLPIIGSIYPFYRKYIGSIQDIAHPKYKAIRQVIRETLEGHPDIVFAAGHEHSLQYSYKDSVHYVVSGSGSKTTPVKKKGYSQFVKSEIGFTRLDYYLDGRVNMQFWSPRDSDGNGTVIFEKQISDRPYVPPPSAQELAAGLNYADSTVLTSASRQYLIPEKKYGLLGANYRKVWAAELELPVFDIGQEHGGLRVVQRGGGMQTKSLRLEADNGKQYVLRSVEKFAKTAVPPALRQTFAANLVQDQISASHPYGAFVVPDLAEAAGIYHTNPRPVFIPDDPRFGIYRQDFSGLVALYEERPDDDAREYDSFGNSKRIYSTPKMLTELYDDNDNYVDQQWVLKSRLFDLLIGDWDRHDDQWRWASFKVKGGKGRYFQPIPRDRDQAFFVNQGFLMGIAKKKWALPKFQGFDFELENVPGFMFNARYFDRDFLTELTREDWVDAAAQLQQRMTDEVFEDAIRKWPPPVYELSGQEVVNKLKARRDDLQKYAIEHYLFLSEAVNVRGSKKREYFKVERLSADDTRVRMYKISKDGDRDKVLYDRTFKTEETKEIRLYGLKGKDEFEIGGQAQKGIKIRVIGGEGKDKITDNSKVSGMGHKTQVYDTKVGNTLNLGGESRNRTSKDPEVNAYNRREFKYNQTLPLLLGNFNQDDGVFIGGGFANRTYGFRKDDPYKSAHLLTGSIAFRTISWDLKYRGRFTETFGKWDLKVNVDAFWPNHVTNFFGLGNETVFDQQIKDTGINVSSSIDYYRVRFRQVSPELLLGKRLGDKTEIGFGTHYQTFIVESDYEGEDRSILDFANSLSGNDSSQFFDPKHYLGLVAEFHYDSRNNPAMPERGMLFNLDLRGYNGFGDASADFTRFLGDLSFYYSFRIPAKVTVALRAGGGHNFGDYEFFQAQILSGPQHLRGYRKTRFFGDSKVFSNSEMRIRLFTLRNKIVPFAIGINGFYDVGRVWYQDQNGMDPSAPGGLSNKWHAGYGGGLWLAPLNLFPIAFELAKSEEETLFYIRFGFMF